MHALWLMRTFLRIVHGGGYMSPTVQTGPCIDDTNCKTCEHLIHNCSCLLSCACAAKVALLFRSVLLSDPGAIRAAARFLAHDPL